MTGETNSRADLRSYYEREAELRSRTELRGRRNDVRADFIELLRSEDRHSVVDFGAGPGLDGAGFVAAGLRFVGVDLAVGNARLAQESGLVVVPSSVDAPPLRPHSFAAGWSMSTLMHLAPTEVDAAVAEMAQCLEVGSPFQVGLWGGPERIEVEHSAIVDHQRPFHLRPADANVALLASAGTVESLEIWDAGPEGWEYQVVRIRIEG